MMPKPRHLFTQALNQTPEHLGLNQGTQPPGWLFYTCTDSETTLIWVQLHRRADWVAGAEKRAFNSLRWCSTLIRVLLQPWTGWQGGQEEEKCPEGSSSLASGQALAGWQDLWGARSVSKVILFVVCTSPPLLRQTLNFRWSCIFIIRFFNLYYTTLLNTLVYQCIPTHTCAKISLFALWPWGD